MTNNIQMIESDAGEVLHLFNVMEKYGIECDLEVSDPFFGIAQAPVKTEYIECNDGGTVVVYLGETEFGFDLKRHQFEKYVSNCQIYICIASEHYAAWFISGAIPTEVITEANSYEKLAGNLMLKMFVRPISVEF